jgi:uncharacterized protein
MKTSIVLCGAALAVSLLPMQAFASCDNADMLLSKAYPKAVRGNDGLQVSGDYLQAINPSSVACKIWPANPAVTLMAVPLMEAKPADPDVARGDVEIVVADTATGKPVARLLEKGMAYSDAIRFADVSIDTARYDIKSATRAFGLRTSQEGSSRVNGYSESALWLYVFEGGRVVRVLDGLIVERTTGEDDGDCEGTSKTIKRTVSLGGEGPHAYRDLLVEQAVTDEATKKVGTECKSTETPGKHEQLVLHFGDKHYDPPPGRYANPNRAGNDLFSLIMTPASDTPAPSETKAPSAASVAPSFNCAKAGSRAEKAICGNRDLAKADVAIAEAYQKLRGALDAKAADLLAQDQKWFLASRDGVFGFGDKNPEKSLLEILGRRVKFLNDVRSVPPEGLVGNWSNVTGDVKVEATADGHFHVTLDTNEPVVAGWVCSTEGTVQINKGVLEIGIEDGSKVRLRREGQTLNVQAAAPPNASGWTPDYCGRNGWVDGTYFSMPSAQK